MYMALVYFSRNGKNTYQARKHNTNSGQRSSPNTSFIPLGGISL